MKSILPILSILILLVHLLRLSVTSVPSLPGGVDWSQYILGAEYIWNHDPSLHYPSWRKPLYPYLLGLFSSTSYLYSGRILASIGLALSLLAMYIQFWKRSPIVSMVMMTAFSVHPLVQDGMNYLNPYPLLGGVTTLGVVLSARKDSTMGLIFVGGLLLGAAIALDGRAWIAILVIGASYFRRGGSIGVWMVWVFGLLPCLFLHLWLMSSFTISVLPLVEQLVAQREFLFRTDMAFQLFPFHVDNDRVALACVGTSKLVDAAWFGSDCLRWIAPTNWASLQNVGILPHWGLLLFLAVSTVWRVRLQTFWGLFASTMLFSLLLWAPPRYSFLSLGSVFVLIGEASLFRKRENWISIVLCMSLCWFGFQRDHAFSSIDYPREWKNILPTVIDIVGDNTLLDCSRKDIWLVHSSGARVKPESLFLSGEHCIAESKTGAYSFLLLAEKERLLVSDADWEQIEAFRIHHDVILLLRRANTWTENHR